MAHWVSNRDIRTGKRKFLLPKINGRVGVSFSIGTKEVFIGVAFADVVLEQLIKKRVVKIPKAETRTYGFDPFSSGSSDKMEN